MRRVSGSSCSTMSSGHDSDSDSDFDNVNERDKGQSKGACTDYSQGGEDAGKSYGQTLCFDGTKGLGCSKVHSRIRICEEKRGGGDGDGDAECRSSDALSLKKKRNNCEAFGDYTNKFDFSHHLKNRELKSGNVGLAHEGFNKTESDHLQVGDDRGFEDMDMMKIYGINVSGFRSRPNSESKEIDLELAPRMADGDCLKAAKEMGSQELTLSYMCDKPNTSFKADSQTALRGSFIGPQEGGEKGKDQGKQLALSLSNGTQPADYCGSWLERDFLHLKTSWDEPISCRIKKGASIRHLSREEEEVEEKTHQTVLCKQRQKKPKTERLQLSLGLPDVSLTFASSNLNMRPALPTQARSIQSLGHTHHTRTSSLGHTNQTRTSSFGHTNHTRTSSFGHTNHTRTGSDGFTTSLEYSQSHTFFHNPSCSLTQNSLENCEYSVDSHPVSQGSDQVSHGNWHAPNANEQVSYGNNGSMHLAQDRLKPGRDISLYQRVLQSGSMQGHHASQCFLGGNNRDMNSVGNERGGGNTLSQGSYLMALGQQARSLDESQVKSDDNERQFIFPIELPERSRRDAWPSPSQSVSSRETRSIQHKQIDKGMSKSEAEQDILFQMDKQVRDGEQFIIRDFITADRILREIVLEPINIMAQKLQELPVNILDDMREYLQDLIGSTEKREHFAKFQKILKRRNDLTSEMLIKSHRSQLEILVTIKTGIKTFLRCNHTPISELVDIFLDLRCRNLDCKSQLPVDDCECKVCSHRSGFCSMCMCLSCSKFDCASNTCSWVGCDICLHWCHTDCGIGKSYIKPSPSVKGASGATEMQFHCIACDHSSEMFGFVKEVFKTFSNEWGAETLVKELDFVRRIFQGSEDARGKQLLSKSEEMLVKLESKNFGPSEACNSILSFFTGFPGDLDVTATYSLSGSMELRLDMEAIPRNKQTPVSLAQHTYWNLAGHNSGNILGHSVQLWGSHVTPVDDKLIPTGELLPVEGTPFDFRKEKIIKSTIDTVPGGYDHNYVLDCGESMDGLKHAIKIKDPFSSRVLDLWTNVPGMQFYTGNFVNGVIGKGGAVYNKHAGLCLETQGFPNAVNQPNFPSIIVSPGEVYKHHMVYKFSLDN